MVNRIYGLADARRSMRSAVRVGKHRMPGAVAQALGLRSQKFFHSFFPWALGMIPSNCQFEISEKNLGKKFPPGGSGPHNFWKSGCIPPRVMCLQTCTQISLKLWLVDVYEDSKYVILAPLRLCSRAQGGPRPNFFLHIFSWVRGMTPSHFQIDILEKNLGKISPQGVRPPQFLEKWMYPP